MTSAPKLHNHQFTIRPRPVTRGTGKPPHRLGIETDPAAGPSKRRSRQPEPGANRETLRTNYIERNPHILAALMC